MNLAIDIGNTRIKFAVFANDQLVLLKIVRRTDYKKLAHLIESHKIKRAIICTTRKRNKKLVDFLKARFYLIEFNHDTPIPIQNKYGTPKTLGKDRLAAAVGAYAKSKRKAHLIIDAGSCITMDFLNKKMEFLGGNISPGIYMRIKAMHKFTDRLPSVERIFHEDIIGNSTRMAMENGAVRGTIFEIQSFIDHMTAKEGRINTILTGGDANFLAKYLKTKILAAPNLVLEGLNVILNYNAKT